VSLFSLDVFLASWCFKGASFFNGGLFEPLDVLRVHLFFIRGIFEPLNVLRVPLFSSEIFLS
jgi:hypothetical protein